MAQTETQDEGQTNGKFIEGGRKQHNAGERVCCHMWWWIKDALAPLGTAATRWWCNYNYS